jgi:Zn finger protein HypA/HybF involved in hydrogenase expression
MSTDSNEPEVSLNVACPHCGATANIKPTSVSTVKDQPDRVEVKMGCRDCNHTWIVQKLRFNVPLA